jgi:simple sugar transport system permease protein
MKRNWRHLADLGYSLISILFSFALVGIIMLILGYDPLKAYASLFEGAFGSSYAISLTLSKSVPLIFVGLAVGFALQGGLFNIGGEGQIYIGGFVAAIAGLAMPDSLPGFISLPLAILSGIAGGFLWGGAIGLIKARLNINEVIVAIMMNYIAQLMTSFFVNGPFIAKGSMTPQTEILPQKLQLSKIIPNTQLTTSLYIAIAMCVLYGLVVKKTTFGFEVRAMGNNMRAAETGGVRVARNTVLIMAFSGGLAAMAGIFEVFGTYGRFIDGFSSGIGFTGIAIAFIGQSEPLGIILASLLFGSLQAGAMQMSMMAGVSANIDKVIQGLVIVFIATPDIIRFMFKRRRQ